MPTTIYSMDVGTNSDLTIPTEEILQAVYHHIVALRFLHLYVYVYTYIYMVTPPAHDPHLRFFLFSLSYQWSHQGMWELAKNTGVYSVFALVSIFMTYMMYVIWV